MTAREYGGRILAAIDRLDSPRRGFVLWFLVSRWLYPADRERVRLDVQAIERAEEGLRDHDVLRCEAECARPCPDAFRYALYEGEGWERLRITGSLYGVTE